MQGDPSPTESESLFQGLLPRAARGDKEALRDLFPLIYDDLRRFAAARMQQEKPGHTLNATAIVHEAFVRMAKSPAIIAENRTHFFAIAAQIIRRVLVDHARGRDRLKRGAEVAKVQMDTSVLLPDDGVHGILEIDEALTKLAELSPRQASVVELRFFGGLTNEEAATHLEISLRTVEADWSMARTWLKHHLQPR